MGPGSVAEQSAERSQVDVEVGGGQVVARLELVHGLLQMHQPVAEALDLLVGQVALVDATQRLLLHQLAHQLDDGQHQLEQVAFHGLRVGLEPLRQQAALLGHRWVISSRTVEISACSRTCTRSTPASEMTTSPASTTPVPSSRSSRSTSEIWPPACWVSGRPSGC